MPYMICAIATPGYNLVNTTAEDRRGVLGSAHRNPTNPARKIIDAADQQH